MLQTAAGPRHTESEGPGSSLTWLTWKSSGGEALRSCAVAPIRGDTMKLRGTIVNHSVTCKAAFICIVAGALRWSRSLLTTWISAEACSEGETPWLITRKTQLLENNSASADAHAWDPIICDSRRRSPFRGTPWLLGRQP